MTFIPMLDLPRRLSATNMCIDFSSHLILQCYSFYSLNFIPQGLLTTLPPNIVSHAWFHCLSLKVFQCFGACFSPRWFLVHERYLQRVKLLLNSSLMLYANPFESFIVCMVGRLFIVTM